MGGATRPRRRLPRMCWSRRYFFSLPRGKKEFMVTLQRSGVDRLKPAGQSIRNDVLIQINFETFSNR
jgi:hypothetical protein